MTKRQRSAGKRGAIFFIAAILVGCASQVLPPFIHADPSELRACAAAPTGCSVWTDAELTGVLNEIVKKAIEYGRQAERGTL